MTALASTPQNDAGTPRDTRAAALQALWNRVLTPRRANIALWAVLLAALPPITERAMPHLFTSGQAQTLDVAACLAMAALALNVLTGYAGQMSLGHAAFLGIGAFASGIMVGRYGLPMAIGVPAAALFGGIVALLLGIPALRLRGLYLAITTIAFGVALQLSILRIPWISGGNAGVVLPRRLAGDLQLIDNADWLAVLLVALLLIWLLDSNLMRSKVGRAFRAIREDEGVAQSFAVNVVTYKLTAFVISGALTGIAGAFYGHTIGQANSDPFSYELSLQLVIMVVVGGLGSRVGVVAAAFFFQVFPAIMPSWFAGYQVPIGAALLMYTVARHPDGIAGMVQEMREQRAMRRERRATPALDDDLDDIDEQGRLPKLPALPRPSTLPPRPEVAGEVVLSARNVSVRFGGLQAVDDVSLDVPRGRIVGLIGPNGAGKTTLFNALSGHIRPQRGEITFMAQDVSALPPHRRAALGMSRSFQLIGLAKSMTVLDNMLLAQHLLGGYDIGSALAFLPKAARVERELIERAHQAIAALGFERFTGTPVRSLSHGQQRIVELGCLLVTDPELLMLDEPSAGMSPGAAENLAVRLRELRDEQARTVLIIEHNIPLVLDVCDEIYVLNSGAVLASGPTETIARRPEVIGAYFGEAVPA
ncbi:MAG TPA: branched-chain amino acid ABC transporter ATP-binding protein/permease [Candidatus Dormibacteraeota bacterium]|jgi:branched-chain amino acid transport system permease protein|nr:branched-chain amino acid ABC transporter ATP-binding protein/permease [Candidatus Dormibacteraeota bacterium]